MRCGQSGRACGGFDLCARRRRAQLRGGERQHAIEKPDAAPRVADGSAGACARARRSLDAGAQPASGYGAAVSADGLAVMLAPELNVYFDGPDTLQALARETGGTVLYSSPVAGKGTIEYGSVDEAFDAMKRLGAKAGIKEVSPRLVAPRRVAK